MSEIVSRLDKSLKDYNLPLFYKDPSFHLSLLWCSGDKKSEINELIKILPISIKNFHVAMNVSYCVCASGNKNFKFNFM